jgi:cellulose synthase/poly-beta-1,6-N-acetylglucosamine synthase-like glycosyltransferase
MDAWHHAFLFFAVFAFCQSVSTLIHTWEHWRYYRRRWTKKLKADEGLRVALIAPCKGIDADLRTNLLALFWQRYPQYEVCFVVESESDPAVAVIRELQREHPRIPCRLIVAGVARDCGQKVHNLMCAARALLGTTGSGEPPPLPPLAKGGSSELKPPDVLAFVDSDACPHVDWLSRLVERIVSGKHAVATGYRWYVPETGSFANRLLSAINNTIIGLSGPYRFSLVWGGAWAIRTETFRQLGLPQAWAGSLSDDLVVSRLVRAAGLRAGFEPHCLVKSAADFDWPRLWEFLRRQFLIVRIYSPFWWRVAFWGGLFTNASLWGLLATGTYWAQTGGPWGLAWGAALLYYLVRAGKASLSARAVRPYVSIADEDYDRVTRLNVWGWPLVSLASWAGIAAGAVGRTIIWRGITYRMDSPRRTTILNDSAVPHLEKNAHARTTSRAA